MFLNTKGPGTKTAAEIGFVPPTDAMAGWIVAGIFDCMTIRGSNECDHLVKTIGELFGAPAVATLAQGSKSGLPTAVIVRPDANIVARLDDELDRFDPDASRRDASYDAFVGPYIETYWRDSPLSERLRLVREAQAPASCVMAAACPEILRDLVEQLVTS